jgi:hypothetical protein
MKIYDRAERLGANGVADAALAEAEEALREMPQLRSQLQELLRRFEQTDPDEEKERRHDKHL